MKKITLTLSIIFLIIFANFALAENLKIEKTKKEMIIIKELNNPAIYDFTLTNNGPEKDFEIYSLVGMSFKPNKFTLPNGETTIELEAYLNEEIRNANKGLVKVDYEIQDENAEITKDQLLIEILPLKDVIEFSFEPFTSSDNKVKAKIKNKKEVTIETETEFKSVFFEDKQTISLNPSEEKEITIQLNEQRDKKLTAGPYIVTTTIGKTEFESTVEFLETEGITTTENSEGFIIKKNTITKFNTGNTITITKTEIKKGIIARLFTTHSPEPTETQRKTFSVTYVWEKSLAPRESFQITTTTNYTIPFILLILIIIVTIVSYFYNKEALTITKSVSFVKTKGGEFALKVRIKTKANKNLEDVDLIDRVPRMTKLFDKFGKKPDRIDPATRRLTWNLGNLDKGETRVLSYIIYSKINIVGRLELPPAIGTFKQNNIQKRCLSNRAFFAKENTDEE